MRSVSGRQPIILDLVFISISWRYWRYCKQSTYILFWLNFRSNWTNQQVTVLKTLGLWVDSWSGSVTTFFVKGQVITSAFAWILNPVHFTSFPWYVTTTFWLDFNSSLSTLDGSNRYCLASLQMQCYAKPLFYHDILSYRY